MCVCFFVCLSPFHVSFLRPILRPLPKVGCPKFFRYSESLGKSAGKKWSQNWTFLLGSGLKLPLIFTAPGVKIGCIYRTIFVLEHSILTLGALLTYLVTWSLPRPLIGHSTGGQNWMHQYNISCVGALHFDPWCTLNLLSGQHKSHHHFPGLSLYWCFNPHRSRDLMSPVCGI